MKLFSLRTINTEYNRRYRRFYNGYHTYLRKHVDTFIEIDLAQLTKIFVIGDDITESWILFDRLLHANICLSILNRINSNTLGIHF